MLLFTSVRAENTHHKGEASHVSCFTRLDSTKQKICCYNVISKVIESKTVKLETSCTVLLAPSLSVHWEQVPNTIDFPQEFFVIF